MRVVEMARDGVGVGLMLLGRRRSDREWERGGSKGMVERNGRREGRKERKHSRFLPRALRNLGVHF